MEGIVLSIDPGQVTGWAIIDIRTEAPVVWGELKAKSANFAVDLQARMHAADLLIIEDQYLDPKKENPDALIKLAALRGVIEGIWVAVKNYQVGDQVCRVKPSKWQASLNLPPQASRESRKRASIIRARIETGKQKISENEADAICLGLAIIRRLKHSEKTENATGKG